MQSMQQYNNNNGNSRNSRMNHFNSASFTEAPKKNRNSVNNDFSETDTDNEIEDFINKNFGGNNDSDDNRNNRAESGSRLSRNNLNESINLKDRKKGPTLYCIEKNENNNNNNNTDELPTESISKTKRSSSSVRSSLVQKSRSILSLFQSEDKKNRSNSLARSSRNEKLEKSNKLKSPFAWNIDWNLYPMPYLHVK